MKKILYSVIIAGLALVSAACQKIDEQKITPSSSNDLTVTGRIVNFDGTKVSYAFSNPENVKSGIKPTWEEGDEIFGFDEAGTTFTFTVSSVAEDGKAIFDTSGSGPLTGKLYAVYYPGEHSFTGEGAEKTLAVDLSSQSGSLDGGTPVIMCATGTIDENNNVNFDFVNQTAIVGIYKMQVYNFGAPVESETVTNVKLKGAVVDGTIKVKDGILTLEAGTTSEDKDLTASVEFTTDKNGYVDVDPNAIAPYFAVIPQDNASLTIEATCSDITCATNAAMTGAIVAGQYYYLGKKIYGGTVAKIGETGYATISEAFAAANDGQTITLENNCTVDSQITLAGKSGTITLDLNDHTLKNGPTLNGKQSRIYLNNENATLVIKDTKTNGTITSDKEDQDIVKVIKGNLIVESGTIEAPAATNGGNAAIWVEPATSGATTNASVTVQGTAIIKGPASVSTENKRAYALYVDNPGAAISVSGGNFSAQSNSMRIMNAKSVDITGGTFTCETEGEYTLRLAGNYRCNIGGTTSVFSNKASTVYLYSSDSATDFVTLNVTDGKYKNTDLESTAIIGRTSSSSKIMVAGGLFNKEVSSSYVVTGYACRENTDPSTSEDYGYKVEPEGDNVVTLRVGSSEAKPYPSIEAAVSYANIEEEDCTITLLADCIVSKSVTINRDVTIDLADKKLTYTSTNRIGTTEDCVLKMKNGTLTNSDKTNVVTMARGGTIEMEDVKVMVPEGSTYVAVMVNPETGKKSTFKMTGGSITAGNASAVNVSAAGGTPIVEIDGAEISGNNSNGAFRIESTCENTDAKVEIKGSNTQITSTSFALNIKGKVPCTIYEGTITSTAEGENDAAIAVSSGIVTIKGGTITGNGNLGALSLTGGTAHIEGGTLLNGITNSVSKVVCTVTNADVYMSGGTIGTLSTAGSGLLRAVRVKAGGNFVLSENGQIQSRRCSFYMLSSGKVEMKGGTINTGADGNTYYAFTIDKSATGSVSISDGKVKIDGAKSTIFGKLDNSSYTPEIPASVTVTLTGGKYTKQPSTYSGVISDTCEEVSISESPYKWQIVEKKDLPSEE